MTYQLVTSLQIPNWTLSKIILLYTSMHMFITLKDISDEVKQNFKISHCGGTKRRFGLKSYGMRCYIDGSVLPDIWMQLKSL
jgi:hypothetical protein